MHIINEENQKFLNSYKKVVKKFFDGELVDNELENYQNQKLNEILEYVYNNSKYYKNALEAYKNKFGSYTLQTMKELPFTTKETLRDADIDILSQPIHKNAYYYETTGTTGKATPCPRSMIDVMSSNITISLMYKQVFESVFGDEKPVVGVYGPTEIHSFGDTLGNVCHNLDLCAVKAWPYSPIIGFEKALELIKKLNIQVIMCTPGLSMTLLKAAKVHGYDIKKDFNIKMFMLTGEMCTEPMINNIEKLWGAKVFNFLYGSQEALVMATCNKNGKMNIFPHNYIYEVINYETEEVIGQEGEGELVVTMLNPGGKPLIRYRTGDIVKIGINPNGPIPSPEIEILGRVKDRILLGGVEYKASDIEKAIMTNIANCLGYQMIIDNPDGLDHVEIKIEMLEREYENSGILQEIEKRFNEYFNIKNTVSFSDELNPVIYTGSLVSWKAARIIDKRTKKAAYDDLERMSAKDIISKEVIKTK
ncbi:phenylacetate--CoA ligase family protein [Ruminiclostridium herbifermentans]|uniref:Phenylacetate--CoA ligase family protein n=1 Tax=Ruminiclostridium herbifermentans TaxID=2488810 RepID=A0A4U7JJW7_9FIRM|nr:AMP-binding protein [Ruminiclostridium herbifermentans]QNU66253.1 phenylacetate--CoA ligase family protein [Ruminiclostridium herbifermentans]